MAASVQLIQYFVITSSGQTIKGGSLSEPKSIALADGEVIDRNFKVAAEGIVKIFDVVEDEALGDFDFLWIETDRDVLVQFTTAAADTDAYDVKTLAGSGTAGVMGPALVLGSNVGMETDGTIDAFDGGSDYVEEVWVKNESTTEVARVRLVVAT